MRIILTRHGETEENLKGILQGHLPGHLSGKGILQAEKLSEGLKNEKFDKIFSSDLDRAADTAREIHKHHNKTPIEFTKEMRELNMGDFQGKKKSDLGLKNEKKLMDQVDFIPGGEKMEEMLLRAKNFLDKITNKYPGKNILLVGHNGINKALVSNILKKPLNDLPSFDNCSVSIFKLRDGIFEPLLINSTEHLN